MIERYTLKEMGSLWTDEAKYRAWLDVEIEAARAMAKFKIIPATAARAIAKKADFDVKRINEIEAETNHDVIACDLNDAPAGVPIDQQQDGRRELPAATGVIDLKAFLGALVQIGYDGPIRAEPFNQQLNAMDNQAALEATAAAMKKAFALVE